jgi:hypothetical protein
MKKIFLLTIVFLQVSASEITSISQDKEFLYFIFKVEPHKKYFLDWSYDLRTWQTSGASWFVSEKETIEFSIVKEVTVKQKYYRLRKI